MIGVSRDQESGGLVMISADTVIASTATDHFVTSPQMPVSIVRIGTVHYASWLRM